MEKGSARCCRVQSRSQLTGLLQNLVALVPLAWLLGWTTEDLSLRCGAVGGGLINATFGNAPELILSIIALLHGLPTVALASLLGSVLSNLLLVLGKATPTSADQRNQAALHPTAKVLTECVA